MTPQLRPYQRASIDALYDYFSANTGNPLIVIPTGGGKTLLAAHAVGLALMGYLFFVSKDFSQTSLLGTLSNTLLFAGVVFQTASIRSLKKKIARRQHRAMLGLIGVFGVAWEMLRIHYDTNTKIFFFGAAAAIFLAIQLHALWQKKQTSHQLRIIFYSVAGELLLTCTRVAAVASVGVTILTTEHIPIMGLFSVWIQYGLKIVVYGALVAYWTEDLAKQKAKAEYESQQFKELSERQEQLIADLGRLNKVATAGVLAASIAHELSQPLQTLVLNIGLSLDEMGKAEPDWQFVRHTLQAQSDGVSRMVDVITTMRSMFTESGTGETQVDLFDLVQSLSVLINSQARQQGVEIEYVRQGDGLVLARATELQQVLLNLIGNAFDALALAEVSAPKIRLTVSNTSAFVICCVEDNGHGIPASMHGEVFKFLKTTKGSGMGLGLWLSKYIVERNRGEMTVDRSAMGGAMFRITLPAHI